MWFFFISDTLTVEKFFLVYVYFGFWMSLVVELFATISLTKYSVLLAFISAPSSSCAFLGLDSWSAPEVLGCSGHASCLSSHPHFVLSQPSVSLTCSFVPDCLSSVQSSLLAVLSTIIYFIHFFFISESFNYLIFSLQNLFPCWSFFFLVSSIFVYIAEFLMNLAVFSFSMADLNGIHVFLCPFSGHWWFLHFNFWNLHPAFNLCQCLAFESSHWGVWLFLKQLCCFASLISWVPVLCFVHLLVCLPSSFIWGSSYCPIKMAESSGPLRQERTTTALISEWPKDLSSYFQDLWDLNLPAGGWHLSLRLYSRG